MIDHKISHPTDIRDNVYSFTWDKGNGSAASRKANADDNDTVTKVSKKMAQCMFHLSVLHFAYIIGAFLCFSAPKDDERLLDFVVLRWT